MDRVHRNFRTNPGQSTTSFPTSTTRTSAVSRREPELHPVLFSSAAGVENSKFEVFVSFSRDDTRRGFTTHLCHSLTSKLGISVVYKNELCFQGSASSISPELLKAIDDSRVAVVVVSRNYADSTSWSLDELVHILRHRKSRGLLVVPIFFDVDPFDVGKQKRSAEHEDGVFAGDEVRRRLRDDALTEVANLPGFSTADYGNDWDMIKEIVGKIWNEVSPTTTTTFPSTISNTNPLVGMDGRVNAVIDSLRLDTTPDPNDADVRMIGICGAAGSGKTTVAMAVYNALCSRFESSTYIASVGEASTTRVGLFRLQKQLVYEIGVEGVETTTWPAVEGFERLKSAYRGKKLLLVLDGVTNEVQLARLGVDRSFFGSGSRVIVTCREEYLVNNDYQTRVDSIYKTPLLDRNEARVLLCLVAFGQEEVPLEEDYRDVVQQILDYAAGVPFVVEVLGRSLRGRSFSEWESTVEKLKGSIPPRDVVLEVL